MPEAVADNYMLGCSSRVILNFNPIHHSWHERYQNDRNLLKTTFKDNPYLPESQISAFERLKTKAESPDASPLDIYNYQVYYCGDFSTASGSIFTNLRSIPYDEYVRVNANEYYGMDFGFRDGGDPTSVVGVKIKDKVIYAHCYVYDNSLERIGDYADAILSAGLTKNTVLWADYGGMGRARMDELIRNYGFTMANAQKPKIVDNIGHILSFEGGVRITQNSDRMMNEFVKYEMINGKLSEKDNHSIDAFRYAFNAAVAYGER